MYHTEGFVNKHTINAEKHIIMLALEEEGRPWYLWCVVKEAIVPIEFFKQVLSFWLQQTLLTKGCNVPTSAQRELNRLGGYLRNMDGVELRFDEMELFMYYKGRFYHWNSEMWSDGNEVVHMPKTYWEISKGIYGYVSEEELRTQYQCRDVNTVNTRLEELANAWELSLVELCSLGKIEHGFFLIWEDKGAF